MTEKQQVGFCWPGQSHDVRIAIGRTFVRIYADGGWAVDSLTWRDEPYAAHEKGRDLSEEPIGKLFAAAEAAGHYSPEARAEIARVIDVMQGHHPDEVAR